MKAISLFILCIFISCSVFAAEIKVVNWVTEEWPGYTNKDGSGLYTQVMKAIFKSQGVDLKIKYVPFARSLKLVKKVRADIAGGIPADPKTYPDHIQIKYPILISRAGIFFRKDTVKEWKGLETIRGRKIAATPTQGESVGIPTEELFIVTGRKQALKMVLSGRAEFYLDDEKAFKETMKNYKNLFNANEFSVKYISSRGWHMIVTNNDRGKKIKEIYEKGFQEIFQTGKLGEIYDKFGYLTPNLGLSKK